MIDWLTKWGVTNCVGFAFREIFYDLAKDGAKSYSQSFFAEKITEKLYLEEKITLQIVVGQLLKEFLELIQDELENLDLDEEEIKKYSLSLNSFIKDKPVQAILRKTLTANNLETHKLAKRWQDLNLVPLPQEFNWTGINKRYQRKVKAIVSESLEFQSIVLNLENKNQEFLAKNLTLSSSSSTELELLTYKQEILRNYGNLRLDSLDTTWVAYDELKLWRIFIPQNVRSSQEFIPQVYEIPKLILKQLREKGKLDAEDLTPENLETYREKYFQEPNQSVLDVVRNSRYQYVVILGDPGSGKSTLMQYLALEWANLSDNLSSHPLPLLIELRNYLQKFESGKCQNFWDFFSLENSLFSHLSLSLIQEKLKSGLAWVLFDGLDEIFEPSQREKIREEIIRLQQDYPQIKIIITSRIIGYQQKPLSTVGFTHFVLQDLDSQQIQDFINRWHELTFYDPIDKNRKQERLQKAIAESRAIEELASNPLLLTMMAILNRNQELPRDRPELYYQASRLLLHQWDTERAIHDARLDPISLDFKDKQAILREVAYFMQTSYQGMKGNLITEEKLKEIIIQYLASLPTIKQDAAKNIATILIDQLRVRNFILCLLGSGYYAFVHRTFLEYFCAWKLVWSFEKERSLELEGLKEQVFGKYWPDETWHEVLRLIAVMIEPRFVGEIIEFLRRQNGEKDQFMNVFLAVDCLAEVRNPKEIKSIADYLLNQVKALMRYELPYYYDLRDEEYKQVREIRIKAVKAIALGWHDDPQTLPFLKSCSQDEDGVVRGTAIEEIAKGWHDDPQTLPFLKSCSQDKDSFVRQTAIGEIAKGWHDDPQTLPLLKSCSQDKDSFVRRIAIGEIAREWHDDPQTLPLLKSCSQDEDWFVRETAIKELARGWHDDPQTLPLLLKACSQDEDWVVRQTAIQEIARGWHDDPQTLPLLKSCSQDKDRDVRGTAIQEIARGWHDDPQTLPILQACSQDKDSVVRGTAIEEIARGWHDDPQTLPFLKACSQDKDRVVRQTAIRELARGWHDHPQTLPFLKSCSQDKDEYVRQTAIQEIARGWHDDPGMFEFLCDRAVNDPYQPLYEWESNREINPRITALKVLAKYYPRHPQLIDLLQDRLNHDPDKKVREFAKEQLERIERWQNFNFNLY